MSPQSAPDSGTAAAGTARWLPILGHALAAAVSAWACWTLTALVSRQPGWSAGILLLGTFGLAFFASEALAAAGGRSGSYRAAFWLSLAIGVGAWATGGQARSVMPWLASIGLGAFAGALLASGRRFGLVENRAPAAALVQEIARIHVERLPTQPTVRGDKRAFDVLAAVGGLLAAAPLLGLSALLLWLENPGPLLFVKHSVGRGGRVFPLLKFRTMAVNSEDSTGTTSVADDDERVLRVGWLLRRTALDELPQLINILRGDMSFVGPRPHRAALVHSYLQTMPEFAERHGALPGLAGLAQVVGRSSLSPRQKLRLDRLYVRHASLGFDLKLLLAAFGVVFYLRWTRNWDGRLPRAWLHRGIRRRS